MEVNKVEFDARIMFLKDIIEEKNFSVDIPDDVISYIANHIKCESDLVYVYLEGAISKLKTYNDLLYNDYMDLSRAKYVLEEILKI